MVTGGKQYNTSDKNSKLKLCNMNIINEYGMNISDTINE